MTTAPAALTLAQASAQCLATGAAGDALLLIEQALAGSGDWATVHARIRQMIAVPIDAASHAGLFYGAPALAFVLHAASMGGDPRYGSAAETLGRHVQRLTHRRAEAAIQRIRRGQPATFGEYDLFHGLVGLGALLLRTAPGSDALADVLSYVTRLTQPRQDDGLTVPGWWVNHDPDTILPTPGGHANLGMAHGAAGLLALLSLATSRGCAVEGQDTAIERLLAWFDTWQQDAADGPWWPQWVTPADVRAGRPTQVGPGRPSWCYKLTELNHEF